MSVLPPQEFFRKIATASKETSERSSTEGTPGGRFRELLKVTPVDDKPRESHFEEEEEIIEGPFCIQGPLSPLPPPPAEKKKESPEKIEVPYNHQTPFIPLSMRSDLNASASIQKALSLEVMALFEKMASCMLVMSSSEDVETTLFLDNPHFASSVFFGTKITVREFSTAPKAFNVEIASSSQAIMAIEASKSDLLAAFQNGNFNFSIHRFDTQIQREERPVLHRKESEDHGNQERKGGREQ
jgi:hypothetical protein